MLISILLTTVSSRPMSEFQDGVDCAEKPDGTFLPDPADCSRFYVCDAGFAWSQQCAPPLFFDPSIRNCNWPNMVDCKN